MPLSKYLITFFIFLVSQQAISACLDGNCTNGTGKYQWASGNTYEGSFVNRKRNGKGTFIWVSGEKYIGEYKDGKMHGQGTFHYDNGDVYTGSYSNNQRNGKGVYRWPNNTYFEGMYVNSKKHGKGKLVLQDGTVTAGEWKNDLYVENKIVKEISKKTLVANKKTKTSLKKKTQVVIESKQKKQIPTSKKASPVKKVTASIKLEPLPETKITPTIDSVKTIAKNTAKEKDLISNENLALAQNQSDKNTTTIPIAQTSLINTQISTEKYPLAFGENWFLNKSEGSSTLKNDCFITSKTITLFDGYTDTTFFLQLSMTEILLKTDSNIDLSYPEVGIQIDSLVAHQITHITSPNIATISEHYKELTSQLVNGQQVTIKLGFWPTWPITRTRHIQYDLKSFNEAYQMLLDCRE